MATTRRSAAWAWPGAVALGFALVLLAWWGPEHLAHGGLAPLAGMLVVAAFLGLPLARREWQVGSDAPQTPAQRGVWALADLWSLLLVGAAAAPVVRAGDRGALVAVLAAWGAMGLAARVTAGWAVPVLALGAGLCAWVGMGLGLSEAPPWTLLEPRWETWRAWWPAAVLGGFLLSAAGWGQLGGGPGPTPGRRHLPWGTAGLALLIVLPLLVRHAAWYEAGAGEGPTDVLAGVLVAVALVAAGTAVLSRDRLRPFALRYAAVGALATVWFAGPAWEARALWWASLAPLGPAVVAAWVAWRLRGADRLIAALGAFALLGAATAGWPGLPDQAVASAAAAILLVVGVWVAGTRVISARAA